jgi:histidinol dehydrogenase
VTLRAFGRPLSPRQAVARILADVEREGDRALVRYTAALEGFRTTAAGLRVSATERRAAAKRLPAAWRRSLAACAERIRAFHCAQRTGHTVRIRRSGAEVAERSWPLDRVGVYVPGGRAPLVSTVLMNVLPAVAAGVPEIVLATPPGPDGRVPDALLYAADLAGVTEMVRLGGAVAVAALGLGTASLRPVDKIFGPGNVYVNEAKRQIFGRVGIDGLAGPSEILIVADAAAKPLTLAWDLIGQGEHGSGAVGILLSAEASLLDRVEAAARAIVREQGELASALDAVTLVRVRDLPQAAALAEAYAPEHLSLQVSRPAALLSRIRHFGAAFLGPDTPQAMGDYTAGPNHILPTGGTARWSSPLSVRDFLRRASVVRYTRAGVQREGPAAVDVARAEGLQAHAESIRQRMHR